MHVSTLRSGFKAAEGGGTPSRFLGINVMGGEVLSYFLCNWPSRSRNHKVLRTSRFRTSFFRTIRFSIIMGPTPLATAISRRP